MSELNKRLITSLFLTITILVSFSNIIFLYVIIFLINLLVIDEFFKMIKKIHIKKISKFLTMLIVLIYMVYFSLVVIYFINQSFEVNKFKVLFLLIICISSDIGGYTFGKIIGGKKLTKISPKKTYSGLVGSLVLSVIFGYLFYISSTDLFFKFTCMSHTW